MSTTRKYDLYSKEFRQNSHAVFAQMRQEAPLIKQIGIDGETQIWFVTCYAEAQQVLLDEKHFVRNPRSVFNQEQLERIFGRLDPQVDRMMNNHMLNRDGEDHRRLRSIVSKAFTPKVIQSMRPRIEKIAQDLLDKAMPNGKMELVSEYAFPLPITVIAELLGIPLDNQNQFRIWSNAFVRPAITPEEQQEAMRLLMEFAAYMQQLVAERRRQPGNDLLSGLILAEEGGDRLDESELFSMLSLLIVAGHETTVSLIGNTVLSLLQHPDTLKEIKSNPEVIPSANRDETQFPASAVLDLHRKQNAHIAFGKGAHYCLGAPLARLEGEIAVRVLVEQIPDLELDISPEELDWRDVPLFHSLVCLPVKWKESR